MSEGKVKELTMPQYKGNKALHFKCAIRGWKTKIGKDLYRNACQAGRAGNTGCFMLIKSVKNEIKQTPSICPNLEYEYRNISKSNPTIDDMVHLRGRSYELREYQRLARNKGVIR